MKRNTLIKHPKLIEFADVPVSLEAVASQLIQQALSASEESVFPMLVHLCGIPGSGKSTYAKKFLKTHDNFARVNFDDIMSNLDEYKKDCATIGLVDAFKFWELPARAIGYHVLQALLEHRRNVLFDHSAAFTNHIDLIDAIKGWGYFIEMHYLDCSLTIAYERILLREQASQQHTPKYYVWQRHQLLEKLIPLYQCKVDAFKVVSIETTACR